MEFRYFNEVLIPHEDVKLKGDLILPEGATRLVVFSHGSGSSRFSKRNKEVASYLHNHNFGTLLIDLLTEMEDTVYQNRFDVELLANRLVAVVEWLSKHPSCKNCQFAFFGASTGAASALVASTFLPEIEAVVSRGGRPDLANFYLPRVKAPTLLLVGSLDVEVIQLNKIAMDKLICDKKLIIVNGATHLFEEPNKMLQVAELATDWFEKNMANLQLIERKY